MLEYSQIFFRHGKGMIIAYILGGYNDDKFKFRVV